jgi:hypothetical protein
MFISWEENFIMQKQTTHTSFEPADMKEYAYLIATRLNMLIKGKAEPKYDRVGIWYIIVSFNNFNFKYRACLSQYFTYKFDIDLAATIIRDNIIKEFIDSVLTDGNDINVIYGKEY